MVLIIMVIIIMVIILIVHTLMHVVLRSARGHLLMLLLLRECRFVGVHSSIIESIIIVGGLTNVELIRRGKPTSHIYLSRLCSWHLEFTLLHSLPRLADAALGISPYE